MWKEFSLNSLNVEVLVWSPTLLDRLGRRFTLTRQSDGGGVNSLWRFSEVHPGSGVLVLILHEGRGVLPVGVVRRPCLPSVHVSLARPDFFPLLRDLSRARVLLSLTPVPPRGFRETGKRNP